MMVKSGGKAPRNRPPPKAAPVDPAEVFTGVLHRMGDIMGPGAIYSLVHYGALEEGLRLGTRFTPREPREAIQAVAGLLRLRARVETDHGARIRVLVEPASHVDFQKSGVIALLVGLLEGVLTSAMRKKYAASGEPRIVSKGGLEVEFAG